jgi:excisionase family DNA binding protein
MSGPCFALSVAEPSASSRRRSREACARISPNQALTLAAVALGSWAAKTGYGGRLAWSRSSSCSSGIQYGDRRTVSATGPTVLVGRTTGPTGPGAAAGVRPRKGCAVAAQPSGKAATTPSCLRTAQVAEILYVSPKTVSRWAKEGKLPFLKILGGHRRYPDAEIRELATELREETTA